MIPVDLDAIDYIGAVHQTPHAGTPTLIVLHSIECPLEGNGRARNVARWFAGPTSPQASAHYCLDVDEVVCGVQPPNVAWHVGRANVYCGSPTIGIEQTGYARFSTEEWLTPDGSRQLDRLVGLVDALCDRWGIARRWVDETGLRNSQTGITTHAAATAAGLGTDHTDPGPNWPVDEFMRRLDGSAPTPPTPSEDDEMLWLARHESTGAVYLLQGSNGQPFWRHWLPSESAVNIALTLAPVNLGNQGALLDILADADPTRAVPDNALSLSDADYTRIATDASLATADELVARLGT